MAKYNDTRSQKITPTISTSAYADGDVIGGLINLGSVLLNSNGGILRRVVLVDDDSEGAALNMYFFDEQPSSIADNAAFAPTLADLQKLVGVVEIAGGDYITVNGNDYVIKSAVNIDWEGDLYLYMVTNGSTPTYTTTSDLYLKFYAWSD